MTTLKKGIIHIKGHMLQQMGDAVMLGRFVAGADPAPDADGGGLDRIHPVGRHAETVGQGGDADGVRGGDFHAANFIQAVRSLRRCDRT